MTARPARTLLTLGASLALFSPLACADEGSDATHASSSTGSTDEGEASETQTQTETETETGEGSESETGDGDGEPEPAPLSPDAGPDRYVLVDELFELDASASTGAVLYHWDFGDGSAQAEPTPDPLASHSYAAPGRYYPVLTAYDGGGDSLATNLTVTATFEPTHAPRYTGSLIAAPGSASAALVSPDSDELLVVSMTGGPDAPAFELARFATCAGPRAVGPGGVATQLVVACPERDRVELFDETLGFVSGVDLPWGSRPSAALVHDGRLWIALAGPGALAYAALDDLQSPTVVPALEDARGLALWPDGRLAISRWRSPDTRGELLLVDPGDPASAQTLVPLAYDPTPPSDTEIGGVPTYLDQILVSPVGGEVAVPSLQANMLHGEYLTGETLTFETTARAVVSFLELDAPDDQGLIAASENFDRRKQFDNRGFAAAGVYSSRGDYLFVAMRGSRTVERYDVLTGAQAGTILNAGYAPSGLALSADDSLLFVEAALSRELRVYDVRSFDQLPAPIATLDIVSQEPLAPEILRGKQLFNDSFDPRLAKHGYIACAHCHLDGEADRRTWDFTDRGEGLRNTISLRGRAGMGHGPVHWSANFDEIQDFEHDLRGPFAGFGLLDDADWNSGTVNQTLGDPKAGLSDDLDALAAYVASLASYPRSPYRDAQGGLSPAAQAGEALFGSDALGCTGCHFGDALSDSRWLAPAQPLLHDVGTLGPGSGLRLGEPLPGLDTPTLHGLWNSPPYLHDGSAADLHALLSAQNPDDLHGVTSQLSAQERDQLVAYLLSLEGP